MNHVDALTSYSFYGNGLLQAALRPADLIRMREEGGNWVAAGTFVGAEAELTNLKRGKELEFHVVALNKAGESLPSNSVAVVL
uniref:fibronectin type III domain-containing protein n=1 Tax=Candidatus Electronema sp. TaxID=2698783 RepID=UPI0040562EFE